METKEMLSVTLREKIGEQTATGGVEGEIYRNFQEGCFTYSRLQERAKAMRNSMNGSVKYSLIV
jgi:hypothetical protein